MANNIYENPLCTRYASSEMLYNFSSDKKFITWRKLWTALAKCEKNLGLNITDEQIDAMENNLENIDYEFAKQKEKELKHDVMAHVYAFAKVAPVAKPIIHLGATSAYVGDNTDLIQIRDGLKILKSKMITVMKLTKEFIEKYKDLPTLGFTHFQPAQLTTVGKRATLWIQSLVLDLEELDFRLENLRFRGVKGTTGTQASFLELFNGDFKKVEELDETLTKIMGFNKKFDVTGQTYDRKIDSQTLSLLSNIAQSAHKFSNDLRLLAHLKEIEEPFKKHQIGSSAMPYKRNPMLSERMASLSRFVISLSLTPAMTASVQWFERTLDDSAGKRLSIPQAFLAVDSVLMIWSNILNGIIVYPKVIEKHIMAEFPFMTTEYIIMEGVKNGGDRQELHEKIRKHSLKASRRIKEEGKENQFMDFIINDNSINIDKKILLSILNPKNFIGLASYQSEKFIENILAPILEKNNEIKVKVDELIV